MVWDDEQRTAHKVLTCILPFHQEENVGFDRKKCLPANLNGSLPDVINLAIGIFCMNIIWLEKWTWGQAVQDCTLICTYDQLFELHCTAD